METINDIVAEMREHGKYNKENGDLDWLTEEVGDLQLRIADRVEAAYKRETVTNRNGLITNHAEKVNSERVIYNTAKLREAIAKCVNLITEFGNAEIVKTPLDVIIDIEAILKAALAAPSEPIGNAKGCEADDWLNQLVNLINGEIAHYMSQGTDYFSVDCGPWHIKYDNRKENTMEANNIQKMREALEKILAIAKDEFEDIYNAGRIEDLCRQALAEPSRNCDKFTIGEALRKYGFPTKSKPWGEKEWLDFCEWYIAVAEGGAR